MTRMKRNRRARDSMMTMIDLMFAACVSQIITIILAGYFFDK